MEVQLEDLLAFYPSASQAQIQTAITAKQEFRELASFPGEELTAIRGEFYQHQRWVQRWLEHYDDLFLFHKTGTGKTCALAAAAEWFHRQRARGGTIRHVYILVRNDTLNEEFLRQIVCRCTDGVYDTPEVLAKPKRKTQRSQVKRNVKEWYTLETYQKFAKKLALMNSDDAIRREYSNTMIFVDEAQNLRMTVATKKGRPNPTDAFFLKETFHKPQIYEQFDRLFHLISNSKKILATATPLINEVQEIAPLINLLLPYDQALPDDLDLDHVTLEELEPYFRGKVSYIRELDTGADLENMGARISDLEDYAFREEYVSETRVWISEMTKFQAKHYLRARAQETGDWKSNERQAANFVFPDGTWGTQGLKKYAIKSGVHYIATTKFQKTLSTLEGIRKLGTKYATILEQVQQVENGNVFIYNNFAEASGAIVLGMCFEAMGYERFSEIRSVFEIEREHGKQAYCDDPVQIRRVRENFPPKKRFVLFTKSTTGVEAMMELMNAPENKHGEYLQVFISSPKGNIGINVNNVVQIHLVGGDWTQALSYQAESRAIRSTSHVELLKEKRAQYITERRDPKEARIEVKIYRHAAVTQDAEGSLISVDLELFDTSERKDRVNKRIERFLKQVAVDCQIQYARNVRAGEVDYSLACDYQVCEYDCFDPPPETIDWTTYQVYYMEEPVRKIHTFLQEAFRRTFSLTIDEVVSHFPDPLFQKRLYVEQAVLQALEKPEPWRDRYGRKAFLRQEGSRLFLDRTYPLTQTSSSYASGIYTSYWLARAEEPLTALQPLVVQEKELLQVDQLKSAMPGSSEFEEALHAMKLDTLASLLEQALSDREAGTGDAFTDVLLERLGLHDVPYDRQPALYHALPEPLQEIDRIRKEVKRKKLGVRGRVPKGGVRVAKLEEYDPQKTYLWDTDTPQVWFHTIYTLRGEEEEGTTYGRVARFNKASETLRIFRPKLEEPWRDATQEEAVVYSLWAQKQLYEFKQRFEEHLVYGFYLGNHVFYVRNKLKESKERKQDKRKVQRGRDCSKIAVPDLIAILEHLEIEPPKRVEGTAADLLKLSGYQAEEVRTWDPERVNFWVSWNKPRSKKDLMCSKIVQKLKEKDRIFRAY